VAPFLDERAVRLVAAAEAFACRYGGMPRLRWHRPGARRSGGSEGIGAGRTSTRSAAGGGTQAAILRTDAARGSRGAGRTTTRGIRIAVRWTCKSVRRLAEALRMQGRVSRTWLPIAQRGALQSARQRKTRRVTATRPGTAIRHINTQVATALPNSNR